jgi:glucokinase
MADTGRRHGRRVVGIDLGGTHLRAALVGADGGIVAARRVRTDAAGGPDAVVNQMIDLIAEMRDEDTAAVGIGIPGAFDGEAGTVLGIPALPGWTDLPLRDRITAATGLACVLENDATAAAYGEWRAGAGQGCRHFVYITVSTGIGAGIIVDGRVLRGVRGLAGEIGHTKIASTSVRCACGAIGCWQAVAAGTALDLSATTEVARDPAGAIARLAAGGPALSAHVGAAARAGDARAKALLAEHARLLGEGFVNAQHLYAPERIVMGGGLSALLDLMADDIAATVAERLLPGFPPVPILPPALGDNAGIVGAALEALETT